jgi:hypothetical protein
VGGGGGLLKSEKEQSKITKYMYSIFKCVTSKYYIYCICILSRIVNVLFECLKYIPTVETIQT